jgi:hypothetical protein
MARIELSTEPHDRLLRGFGRDRPNTGPVRGAQAERLCKELDDGKGRVAWPLGRSWFVESVCKHPVCRGWLAAVLGEDTAGLGGVPSPPPCAAF